MPPAKRPLPDDGDIWDRHQTLLKNLYETARKTLEEVKLIMETEHGFPDTPLSTYEAKLRDKLHLRKKLKKTDWPVIYQHHLRRRGKDSAIHLNGSLIPWKKVWKEIRRSGAHLVEQELLSPGALPAGVTIRTPPRTPPPARSFIAPAPQTQFESNAHTSLTTLSGGLQMPLLPTMHGFPETFNIMSNYVRTGPYIESSTPRLSYQELPGSVLKSCLMTTPWREFLSRMDANSLSRDSHTDYHLGRISLGIGTGFGQKSASPQAQNREIGSNFDTYHFLAKVMNILSNNLEYLANEKEIMDVLFTRVPKSVLLGLLDSDIPTVRGVWETLVRLTREYERKEEFSLLFTVAERHPHWIGPAANEYLSYAAYFGCLTSIQYLLALGARPVGEFADSYCGFVLETIEAGNIDAARMLIQHCDVNHRDGWNGRSVFDIFMAEALFEIAHHTRLGGHFSLALDMLLESGADVDRPLEWSETHRCYCSSWQTTSTRKEAETLYLPLPMTWLDNAYWHSDLLFRKLARYSNRSESEITRAGICTAASQSTESLRHYLQSRPTWSPEFLEQCLECVLFELFYHRRCLIDPEVIQNLINYGVDIRVPSMSKFEVDTFTLLHGLIGAVQNKGSILRFKEIVDHLLQAGAQIDSKILVQAVEEEGFYLLEMLTDVFGANIQDNGAQALGRAADHICNNEDAVIWLIQRGADVEDAVRGSTDAGQYIAIAKAINHICNHEKGIFEEMRRKGWAAASPEILKHLSRQAAKLEFRPFEITAFNFLRRSLQHSRLPLDCHNTLLREGFQKFLNTVVDLDDDPSSEETLLESCLDSDYTVPGNLRRSLFGLLFRRGAPVWPHSPLARLICAGGSHDLIQEVIEAGADINGVSVMGWQHLTPLQAACGNGDLELVSDLLQRGANVNAPAEGGFGETALQFACGWGPCSTEEELRKTKLIRLLIDRGADVNAEPTMYGRTALQTAACCGDLETAFVLLEHNADINAPGGYGDMRALDNAAREGRLDMVKFLLNANALSQYQGLTGYDGAVQEAEAEGHFAVAELIRKHAADNTRGGIINPQLVPGQ